MHVPRVTLSSRVAIVNEEDKQVDRSLRRQHPIPDTDEIGNRLRMPNFQNQGRKGVPRLFVVGEVVRAHCLGDFVADERDARQRPVVCLSRARDPDV